MFVAKSVLTSFSSHCVQVYDHRVRFLTAVPDGEVRYKRQISPNLSDFWSIEIDHGLN